MPAITSAKNGRRRRSVRASDVPDVKNAFALLERDVAPRGLNGGEHLPRPKMTQAKGRTCGTIKQLADWNWYEEHQPTYRYPGLVWRAAEWGSPLSLMPPAGPGLIDIEAPG